jgi:hypothetical protein
MTCGTHSSRSHILFSPPGLSLPNLSTDSAPTLLSLPVRLKIPWETQHLRAQAQCNSERASQPARWSVNRGLHRLARRHTSSIWRCCSPISSGRRWFARGGPSGGYCTGGGAQGCWRRSSGRMERQPWKEKLCVAAMAGLAAALLVSVTWSPSSSSSIWPVSLKHCRSVGDRGGWR